MDNKRGKLSIMCRVFCLLSAVLFIICFTVSCDMEAVVVGNSSNESSAATGEMVTVDFAVTLPFTPRSGLNSPPEGELEGVFFPFPGELEGAFYIRATLSENIDPVSLRSMTLDAGTKIRIIAYTISSGDTTTVAFADYEIAGGGGGWVAAGNLIPGAGGGLSGSNCIITYGGLTYTAYGGTQTAGGTNGGSFGLGGNGSTDAGNAVNNALSHRAGGGGGYYGGGYNVLSGGGGSSFISGHPGCDAVNSSVGHTGQPNHFSGLIFTNTLMTPGYDPMPNPYGGVMTGNAGNGVVFITYLCP